MGAQVKVLQKGKVPIPADIREALGVDEGDYVTMEFQGGRVVISPVGTMTNPTEAISGLVSGVTVKGPMDKEIAKAGAARVKRKLDRGSSK
jgi:AbrB family looped-hinge helix DNA binding protein